MRLLFLGDVMGRSGRAAVSEHLPRLRRDWRLDFVVVNGENATGGVGISAAHAELLLGAGADCITLGDHAFDQREMLAFVEREPRMLRPLNFAKAAPGQGARFFEAPGARKVFVAQVLGRVFMKAPFDDPFSAIEEALRPAILGGTAQAIVVDVHAEATSEKVAMGWHLDGKVTAVVGTHTHVQTADDRILPRGTAYLTDVGMTGPHDSVIGVDIDAALGRFRTAMPARFETAAGNPRLNAAVVEADETTGLATDIERLSYSLDEIEDLARESDSAKAH